MGERHHYWLLVGDGISTVISDVKVIHVVHQTFKHLKIKQQFSISKVKSARVTLSLIQNVVIWILYQRAKFCLTHNRQCPWTLSQIYQIGLFIYLFIWHLKALWQQYRQRWTKSCVQAYEKIEIHRSCTGTEGLLSSTHRHLRSWKRCQHAFNLVKSQGKRGLSL